MGLPPSTETRGASRHMTAGVPPSGLENKGDDEPVDDEPVNGGQEEKQIP